MRPHSGSELIAKRCAELRQRRALILSRNNALKPPTETDDALGETVVRCENDLKNSADMTVSMLLNVMFNARIAACRELRFFRINYGIRHTAATPSITKTCLIISPLFIIEGLAMGATMMSSGDMNPIQAIGYGLIFTTVNIALALSAGFFCTRYLNYRANSQYGENPDAWIRYLARAGMAAHLSLLALLVFSTLRVRALGHHEGIFNFGLVPLWESFDSGFTLAILGVSFLSTIIGIYEGRHGFSDPIPGYTVVQCRAKVLIDEQAEDLVDHGRESIGHQADNTKDEIDYRIDIRDASFTTYNHEINALRDQCIAHNNAVLAAKDEARVFAEDFSTIEACPLQPYRLDAFDSLLLTTDTLPPVLEDTTQLNSEALITRISRAHDIAEAQILAAHAEYMNRKPNIEFPGYNDATGYSEATAINNTIGGSAHA